MRNYINFCILLSFGLIGQESTIWNTTVHVGNGEVIENGTVVFENGKIKSITKSKIDSTGKKVINGEGKHLYPGFIAPNSTVGLIELESVRGQRDIEEVGDLNPNVRTVIAFNNDSDIIPTLRKNGVLIAEIAPRGELLSGQSSVILLDGSNWEDAAYKTDIAVHLTWPSKHNNHNWWEDEPNAKANEKYEKQLIKLDKIFNDAKIYAKSQNHETKNLKLEAMKGLYDGTKKLLIYASNTDQIIAAHKFCENLGIKNLVIIGALNAEDAIPYLAKYKIPVIFTRVHSLPFQTNSSINQAYSMPLKFKNAGILYGLCYEGDMEAMGTRNLPFTAGTTVAYGLSKEEALSSITLNTAKILGIDQTCGSIEIGKDATLFLSEGDALDIMSNQITLAWIKGKKQSLRSKQDDLYDKYK